MSAPQVNGEVHPFSAITSHITGYPVVSDSLEYFKQNPYGQKSLQLSESAYNALAKPLLPYFSKPYEYVSPYVKKADSMGDEALNKVDQRIPALKKPTGELWTDGKNFVFFPVRKGYETKDHVFTVYNSEYKKVGGEGAVTTGKAFVSTGLVVTVEALNWMGDMIRAGKTKAKETGVEVANNAS